MKPFGTLTLGLTRTPIHHSRFCTVFVASAKTTFTRGGIGYQSCHTATCQQHQIAIFVDWVQNFGRRTISTQVTGGGGYRSLSLRPTQFK